MFLINPYIYATDAWSNLKSISFDGVDEIVNIGDIAILDSVANYSVSMWVKTSSLATLGVLIGKKTSTSSTNWNIHIQSDGSLGHSIQAAAAKTAASDITINTWHHIAATYNGGAAAANRVQLYVDGVSSLDSVTGTIPSSTLNNSHAQYIGGRNVGDSSIDFPFTGNIDEVGIFDYTLTSGEVTALYNSGCPNDLMTLAAAKRPEHYYRMGDNDTYPTINDIGETGGNNGTMTNAESTDIVEATPCWNPYIVDAYSLRAAYSLRKLSSSTTNVIRVRRSSDSAESDFSAEDIDDGTLATWSASTDSFVVTIYNQGSLASADLTQSTAANQPKIVTNGVVELKGSLPCMVFDGSNDNLGVATAVFDSTPGNRWFFGVASPSATATAGCLFGTNSTLNNSYVGVVDSRTTPNRNLYKRWTTTSTYFFADLSTARVDTLQRLTTGKVVGLNMSGWDNGITGGTGTSFNQGTNTHLYMGSYSAAGGYLSGTVQELIINSGVDLTSDRVDIENNINDYYSIY